MLQASLLQIVAASTFAIVAAALESHVNEASRRGWALPTQLPKSDHSLLLIMRDSGLLLDGVGFKVQGISYSQANSTGNYVRLCQITKIDCLLRWLCFPAYVCKTCVKVL